MSKWTHFFCKRCYQKAEPDNREPILIKNDTTGHCCSCGSFTSSGIYYKHNPTKLLCLGEPGWSDINDVHKEES